MVCRQSCPLCTRNVRVHALSSQRQSHQILRRIQQVYQPISFSNGSLRSLAGILLAIVLLRRLLVDSTDASNR
jgi:hypothetical protein